MTPVEASKKKNDIRIIKTVDMGISLQLSAVMINTANQFSIQRRKCSSQFHGKYANCS